MMVGELSYSLFAGRSGEQTHVQPQFQRVPLPEVPSFGTGPTPDCEKPGKSLSS